MSPHLAPKSPGRILIVEDDAANAELLTRTLQREGYEILTSQDGELALEQIRTHRPDVVLLDVVLPGLGGFDVCRRIKEDPTLAGVFVALISSHEISSEKRIAGLEHGADDYLVRPLPLRELCARMRTVMRLQHAEAAARESSQFNHQIIARAREGIAVYDRDLRCVVWNPFLEELTGVPAAQVIGRPMTEAFPFFIASGIASDIERARSGEIVTTHDATIQIAERERVFCVTAKHSPLRDGRGEITGVLGTLHDITLRKSAEAKLHHLNHYLDQCVADRTAALEIARQSLTEEITGHHRAAARLAAFAHLGQRLNTVRSPAEAARVIVDIAEELLGWDCCFMHLHRPEDDRLVPVLVLDTVDGLVQVCDTTPFEKLSPVIRRVLQEGAFRLPSSAHPAGSVPLNPFGDVARPSAARLYVPLRSGTKVVGVLSIQSYRADAYDDTALATLQALGDHCGGALERIHAQAAVLEGEKRFHTFMDHSAVYAWMKDAELRYLYVNKPVEQLFGVPLNQLRGRKDREVWTAELAEQFEKTDHEVLRSGRAVELIEVVPGPNGSERVTHVHKFPFTDSRGRACVGGMAVDITDRWRAEEELRRQSRQLLTAQHLGHFGNWVWDFKTRRSTWSDELFRQTGLKRENFDGTTAAVLRTIHPEDRARIASLIQRTVEKHEPFAAGYRIVRPDGGVRHIESHGEVVFGASGEPEAVWGVHQDVTERQAAESVLRAVSQRIFDAQEQERRRVARDLHDGVSQIVATANQRLKGVQEKTPVSGLSKVIGLLAQARRELQNVSRGLLPEELDDLGLAAALRSTALDFQERTGVAVRLHLPRRESKPAGAVELALYRVAQEALSNVERHARARNLRLRLARCAGGWKLHIRDDGRGFSLKPRRRKSGAGGLGLLNMRERAQLAGGTFKLTSALRAGTEILVWLPAPETAS